MLTHILQSWVMIDPKQGFVRLPGEKHIFSSPPRTGFSIATPRAYPGNNPLSIQSNAGIVYLTNQRVSHPYYLSLTYVLTLADRISTRHSDVRLSIIFRTAHQFTR